MLSSLLLESDSQNIFPYDVEFKIKGKIMKYFGESIAEEDLQKAFLHNGEVILKAYKSSNCVFIYNKSYGDEGASCRILIDKHDKKSGLFAYIDALFLGKPTSKNNVITV